MIFDLPPEQPAMISQIQFPIREIGKAECVRNGYNADSFKQELLQSIHDEKIDARGGLTIFYISSFMQLGLVGAEALVNRHAPIAVVECGENIVNGRLPMILGDHRRWHYQLIGGVWLLYYGRI